MDFAAKIVLFEGECRFFGPGVRDLLRYIDSEKSVKHASTRMKISYSKAWKMINNVEKALGEPAVVRTHGGADGGGSAQLTEAGRRLLERYESFERQSNDSLRHLFEENFKDLI